MWCVLNEKKCGKKQDDSEPGGGLVVRKAGNRRDISNNSKIVRLSFKTGGEKRERESDREREKVTT